MISKTKSIFSDFYTLNRDIHGYNTRLGGLFHIPFVKIGQTAKFIRRKGVAINNYFTRHVDNDCILSTYKLRLKQHILSTDQIPLSLRSVYVYWQALAPLLPMTTPHRDKSSFYYHYNYHAELTVLTGFDSGLPLFLGHIIIVNYVSPLHARPNSP